MLKLPAVVAALYLLCALIFTYPLALHFSSRILGGAQDYPYLWNVWHFWYALRMGENPFWTDLQHHPIGANLLTHTYTLGHGLIGAVFMPWLGAAGSLNLSFLLCIFLAAWGGYRFCRHLGCSVSSSFLAGFLTGFNPFATQTYGSYYDYIGYWPVIFFVWRFHRAQQKPALMRFFSAAIFMSFAFLYAQMYFSFCVVFAVVLTVFPHCKLYWKNFDREKPLWTGLCVAAATATLASLSWLAMDLARIGQIERWEGQGGFWTILRYVLPYWLSFASLCCFWILWKGRFPGLSVNSNILRPVNFAPLAGTLLLYSALNAGLIWASLKLAAAGLDIDAPARWRGGGTPLDLFRYVIPNLDHPLLASIRPLAYQLQERNLTGSMGWVLPLFLLFYLRRKSLPQARLWLVMGILNFVLSLGPYLMVGEFRTYIPLPFWLIRLVPLIGSPIQAVSFLNFFNFLFFGAAAAMALDDWRRNHPAKSRRIVIAAYALILFESMITLPKRTYALPAEKIHKRLEKEAPGGVLIVPFGVHLRFAGNPFQTTLNPPNLLHQITHHHPVVGGFITRAPLSTFHAFVGSPFLTALEKAQRGESISKFLTDPQLLRQSLRIWDVRYVLVIEEGLPAPLLNAIGQYWPLEALDQEGTTRLYRVNLEEKPLTRRLRSPRRASRIPKASK